MAFIALCKCVCALKLFALPPHPWVSLLYVYRFDPLPACGYLSHAIIRCLLIAYEHPNPNLLQGVCLPASIHSISTANIRDHIRCTEIHHCQISMFHCVILLNARLRISGSHLRGFFSDDWWCAWNLFLRFYFNLFFNNRMRVCFCCLLLICTYYHQSILLRYSDGGAWYIH